MCKAADAIGTKPGNLRQLCRRIGNPLTPTHRGPACDLGEEDIVRIRRGRLARGSPKEAHREHVEGRGSVVPKEGTTSEPIIQEDPRVL